MCGAPFTELHMGPCDNPLLVRDPQSIIHIILNPYKPGISSSFLEFMFR